MNDLLIAAIPLGGLAAGWAVNKQLSVNRQVADTASKVDSMEKTLNHTRDRVDAIYEHLLSKKQGD